MQFKIYFQKYCEKKRFQMKFLDEKDMVSHAES